MTSSSRSGGTSSRTPVEPPATPEEGYHLTEDLADRAIAWIRQQKALMPDRPFFTYFAPGATHAPHHVPKEWADKYAGQFDDGWAVQRERTFAKQKEMGAIPADAELTARHDEIASVDLEFSARAVGEDQRVRGVIRIDDRQRADHRAIDTALGEGLVGIGQRQALHLGAVAKVGQHQAGDGSGHGDIGPADIGEGDLLTAFGLGSLQAGGVDQAKCAQPMSESVHGSLLPV